MIVSRSSKHSKTDLHWLISMTVLPFSENIKIILESYASELTNNEQMELRAKLTGAKYLSIIFSLGNPFNIDFEI